MNKFRKLIRTTRGFFFTLFVTLITLNLSIDLFTYLRGGEPQVVSSFVIALFCACLFTALKVLTDKS